MFEFLKKKKPAPVVNIKPEPLYKKFTGKQNVLKDALKVAINALQKDFIEYNWLRHKSCNCGVVVQALLNATPEEVKQLYIEVSDGKTKTPENTFTWRELMQQNCSVTGMPLHEVFKVLYNYGLKPEDMVHLEFLNNPAIAKISRINFSDKEYFKKKQNLILYLKAWLKILDNELDGLQGSERLLLEAKLLIAVNAEDYQKASEIKNQIAVL